MDCVYKFFSKDHWDVTKEWKWNKKRQQFDNPEQQHMAVNVLCDPMSTMIESYNQKQMKLEKEEIAKEKKEPKVEYEKEQAVVSIQL